RGSFTTILVGNRGGSPLPASNVEGAAGESAGVWGVRNAIESSSSSSSPSSSSTLRGRGRGRRRGRLPLMAPSARPTHRRVRSPREAILAALLLVTVAGLGWRVDGFLSATNLTLLASDRTHIGLLAIGMTFVILIAGIDLSVGSTVALSGIIFGL